MHVGKLHALGWRHKIELRDGITSVVAWFHQARRKVVMPNPMFKCAHLSMENNGDFVIRRCPFADPHFNALGWEIDRVPWRRENVDWSAYNLRSYPHPVGLPTRPDGVSGDTERIAKSGTILQNPLRMVRWNMDKTYLRDLESVPLPIARKTLWGEASSVMPVQSWF